VEKKTNKTGIPRIVQSKGLKRVKTVNEGGTGSGGFFRAYFAYEEDPHVRFQYEFSPGKGKPGIRKQKELKLSI